MTHGIDFFQFLIHYKQSSHDLQTCIPDRWERTEHKQPAKKPATKGADMKRSNKTKSVINLFLIGLILNACTSSGIPLNITSVKVFPEPIVGQIVTLEVKILSTDDEPYVKFSVDTREEIGGKVHLIGGDTIWEGSLVANRPQKLQVQVCVVEEGSWPVEFSVTTGSPDNRVATQSAADGWSGIAVETIQLESTLESGKLIRARDYRVYAGEGRPTPRPFTVSPECSGNSK